MRKLFTLLCFMTLSLCGKAAVVITDLVPDSVKVFSGSGSSWFPLDLNSDGTEDFNVLWQTTSGRFGTTSFNFYGPATNEIAVEPFSAISLVIDSSALIDNTLDWATADVTSPFPVSMDNFTDAGNKFIGVRFTIGTATHYGWIHIGYTSSFELTIMSFAYESTAGKSIMTPFIRPVTDFTTATTTTDTKAVMTFTDASTNIPTAWEWTFTPATVTFMGGTNATSQNPQVQFTTAGKYTVKLKAGNTAGSDSITKTDYMTVVAAPVADFNTTTTTTDTKTTVSFTDASANTPTAWEWTFTPATVAFMGGTSASSQDPQVQFTAAGKYTVKLKVSNTAGSDSITKTNYMTIAVSPVADFTTTATTTDTKTVMTFTDASTNTPTAWQWTFTPATVTFMGGTSATSQNPKVLFGATGKYTVKLKATNIAGSDSVTKTAYMEVTKPTGINTYTTGNTLLSIFPNPASKSLTIQNPGEGIISILDINGKTEWSAPVSGKTMQVDISGLPKGYYTLRVAGEHGVTNSKLIVQ